MYFTKHLIKIANIGVVGVQEDYLVIYFQGSKTYPV